jgi:PKD repeat protein
VWTPSQTQTIYLIENSTGTNLSYYWDFGDSSYSTDQYPVHVYSDFGTYDVCLTVADTQSCTSTYCLTLDLDSVPKTSMGFTLIVVPEEPTSVIYNPWMDNTHVAIYPNPTSGQLTISGDKGTTEVYDMYGRKVLKTNSSQIDLSNEPPGIYFIQLTTEEGSRFVKKVVKHK